MRIRDWSSDVCSSDLLRLTDPERAALPVLARGACIRFALTRAWDWLNTPADPPVTRKDPRASVHRLHWYATHPQAFACRTSPLSQAPPTARYSAIPAPADGARSSTGAPEHGICRAARGQSGG